MRGDRRLELRAWPSPYGEPFFVGTLKSCPEDFQVIELLDIDPAGQGEFDLLEVRKRCRNTVDVARDLARFAHVPYAAVSYAGLKDKQAVTIQHYSVHLPGKPSPDWSQLDEGTLTVLRATRHHRKLRRGALTGNRFTICVRQLEGDLGSLVERANSLAHGGIANYFGPQRFGFEGGNLEQATRMLEGDTRPSRQLRSILLSAARSFLFNEYLAERVTRGNWNACLDGDFMMRDGAQSIFGPATSTPELEGRLMDLSVHPTGPLPGLCGRDAVQQFSASEQACLAPYQHWIDALGKMKVKQSRRPLRTQVRGLKVELVPAPDQDEGATDLHLDFTLDAGCYATTVLQQLGLVER